MTPMGERIGTCMTKSKNLAVMILPGFVMGLIITVSEPDLQVLAEQVPSIPNMALILVSNYRRLSTFLNLPVFTFRHDALICRT